MQGDAAAGKQAPPAPPTQPIRIHVAFSKRVDASTTSAVSFVPGHDSCDTCEDVSAEKAAQRYLVSDPQLRRARALFPCSDVAGTIATYAMHVTVPPDHVAVCDGVMKRCTLSHVMTEDGQQVSEQPCMLFE